MAGGGGGGGGGGGRGKGVRGGEVSQSRLAASVASVTFEAYGGVESDNSVCASLPGVAGFVFLFT